MMPADLDQMLPSHIDDAALRSLQQGVSWEVEIKAPRTEVLAVLLGISLVDASILFDTHIERGRE